MKILKKILRFLVLQFFVILMSTLLGIEIAKFFGSADIGKAASIFLLIPLTWVVLLDQFFETKKENNHE